MTSWEFLKGWLILTAQPWGKPYRSNELPLDGQPNIAKIQSEFYWQTVSRFDGEAWSKACQRHATGERWPSLDTLTSTMNIQVSPTLRLNAPADEGVSLEEALKERPDLIALVKRVRA